MSDRPAAPVASILAGVLCLAGPTASGKTAAALTIAQVLADQQPPRGVEIISVDSALVYRGMDIGTAKPSAAELAQVPHHLIDIIDAAESYSAARFVTDAQRLATLDDPRATGKALSGPQLGTYWRYRVGDYRIICDIKDDTLCILVIELGNRREIYR